MRLSKIRQLLYRTASRLGDIAAVSSGDPKRIAKRVVRKLLYRLANKTINRRIR